MKLCNYCWIEHNNSEECMFENAKVMEPSEDDEEGEF